MNSKFFRCNTYKKNRGVGRLWLTRPWYFSLPFTAEWQLTTVHRRSAAAPVARKPPSRLVRASSAQTLARRDPLEFAGTPQSAPALIRGRKVRPDSTESNSLSRFSAAPPIAPRVVHLPPHRSFRRASRIQTSDAPTFAADIPCRRSLARKADI